MKLFLFFLCVATLIGVAVAHIAHSLTASLASLP